MSLKRHLKKRSLRGHLKERVPYYSYRGNFFPDRDLHQTLPSDTKDGIPVTLVVCQKRFDKLLTHNITDFCKLFWVWIDLLSIAISFNIIELCVCPKDYHYCWV